MQNFLRFPLGSSLKLRLAHVARTLSNGTFDMKTLGLYIQSMMEPDPRFSHGVAAAAIRFFYVFITDTLPPQVTKI